MCETREYEYEQLSEAAQNRACDQLRDINVTDFDWWEYSLDYWMEKLAEKGYTDADIRFSGFCSQGDGASFTAGVDVSQWIRSHKGAYNKLRAVYVHPDECWAEIKRHPYSRYVHAMTVYADTDCRSESDKALDQLKDWQEWLIEDVRDWCHEIYHELETEYDYLTSDEAVVDTIVANGYLFTEDGTF